MKHAVQTLVTLALFETLTDSTGAVHDVEVRAQSISMVDLIGETSADDAAHVRELVHDLAAELLDPEPTTDPAHA